MTLLVIVAALGWGLTGLFAGLWIGERGRRRDLTWLTDREERPAQPAPATYSGTHPDQETIAAAEVEDLAHQILDLAVEGGKNISLDEAREDARQMIEQRSARIGEVV